MTVKDILKYHQKSLLDEIFDWHIFYVQNVEYSFYKNYTKKLKEDYGIYCTWIYGVGYSKSFLENEL